jgi:hypothetical protein
VLLKSGDFVEGEINTIRSGEIDVGSVVLGAKKVSLNQAVAVILRDVRPTPAKYEVTTQSGALYRMSILRLESDAVLVSDAAFGSIKIGAGELRELRAGELK